VLSRPSSRSWVVLAVLMAVGILGLVGCNSAAKPQSSPVAASSTEPTATATYVWSDARAHMGETGTFTGPVVATIYEKAIENHPTFLNMGVDYPDVSRLSVMIWEKDRSAFPEAPEVMYANKKISVTGKVIEYQKAPAIEISSPDSIKVLN